MSFQIFLRGHMWPCCCPEWSEALRMKYHVAKKILCQFLQNPVNTHKTQKFSMSCPIFFVGGTCAPVLVQNGQKNPESNPRMPRKMLCQFLQILQKTTKKHKTCGEAYIYGSAVSLYATINIKSIANQCQIKIKSKLNQNEIDFKSTLNWLRIDFESTPNRLRINSKLTLNRPRIDFE